MSQTITKAAIRKAAESQLEKTIARWASRKADDYGGDVAGVFRDLFYGGCASGMVGGMVYYCDTVRFFEVHAQEILAMAHEQAEEMGHPNVFAFLADLQGAADVNDYDQFANLLAWYGFEEAARRLAQRAGYED